MQFREFPTTICKYIDIYMFRVNFRTIGASSVVRFIRGTCLGIVGEFREFV